MNDKDFVEAIYRKLKIALDLCGERNVYIYGAGHGGKLLYDALCSANVFVKGFIDRNHLLMREYQGLPILGITEVNPDNDFAMVSLMNYDRFLVNEFQTNGFRDEDYYVFAAGELLNKRDIDFRGCNVGAYTYGYESFLEYGGVSSIGRYCSINHTARVVDNHFIDGVSTHPMLSSWVDYSWERREKRKSLLDSHKVSSKKTVIGNDVWIGANVVIMQGVKVGDGVIIGAGAVVTKDLSDYGIYAGVPAKLIRYRFSPELISLLERIQWWNWDRERIEDNIELFYEPEKFYQRIIQDESL